MGSIPIARSWFGRRTAFLASRIFESRVSRPPPGVGSRVEGGVARFRGETSEAAQAAVAQLVERVLGKDEVMGSSPISSSFLNCPPTATVLVRLFPGDPGKMFQVSRETMFRQVFTHAGILVQK